MIDVLIPTYERPAALAVTLTALSFQNLLPTRMVIADQSAKPVELVEEVRAAAILLRHRGIVVTFERNLPRRGLAQQRQFLLDLSAAARLLFLDDDVTTEPWLLAALSGLLDANGCGFVGSAVIGLSHADDYRPHEQAIELWAGAPTPEHVVPDEQAWRRHLLHNAANLLHVQDRLGVTPAQPALYKVAWVGGCVLYDREKLLMAGGFDFWRDLPTLHAGEDVFAQQRVMALFGGAGMIPSGAYHQEVATTVADRSFDAPRKLALARVEAAS